MLNESTATQGQVEDTEGQVCLGEEVDRLAMASLFITAGLVGAWTLARIGSAMYASGGPLALVQSWLTAVSGGAM